MSAGLICSVEVRAGQALGQPDEAASRNWAARHDGDGEAFERECERAQGAAMVYAIQLQTPSRYRWIELTWQWSEAEEPSDAATPA